jgi:hypothetical protein
MPKRVVTFEKEDGSGFRLVTPEGYRDFENGILSTDDDDPALPFLLEWAAGKSNIKVTDTGTVTKVAVMTCPVCGATVDSEEDLAAHTEDAHVQPESKGERKPPVRRRR